jgi:putative FmdB family regulatory protein
MAAHASGGSREGCVRAALALRGRECQGRIAPESYSLDAMPIYEYKCKKGHVFEVMQSFSDEALTTCEVCGAPVQRVYHPVSVHFKGSGFYNTDYGTKRRAREKEQSSKESSSSDTSSSSEKKPDSGSKPDSGKSSSSESKAAAA